MAMRRRKLRLQAKRKRKSYQWKTNSRKNRK